MTPETRERLSAQLLIDEGLRLKPYIDTVGKTTIGIGRNLTDVGISAGEASVLLDSDLDRTFADLSERFPQFLRLDEVRQAVLLNLAFNIGVDGLAGFHDTLASIWRGDYETAATHMLQSRWATQTGLRAVRLANAMRTGAWPADGYKRA